MSFRAGRQARLAHERRSATWRMRHQTDHGDESRAGRLDLDDTARKRGRLALDHRRQKLTEQALGEEVGPPFPEDRLESRQQPHAMDGTCGKTETLAKGKSR